MSLPYEELGDSWRAARPPAAGIHLDSAACSRSSRRVMQAVARHAEYEAEVGGYIAEAAAEPFLRQMRSAIGALVGMTGDDVVFVDSATSALARLLHAWRLPPGTRVACLPGEWGINLALLVAAGLDPVLLPVDPDGRVEPERVAQVLRAQQSAMVHVTSLGSHRGVVQPAGALAEACRESCVPLVLDVAQALGHVECAVGADAVYSTARKWLTGPRGVGILAIRPSIVSRLTPVLDATWFADDLPPARRFESSEGHVAGRVGLGLALEEYLAAGPARVRGRLSGLGRLTRQLCDGVGGWRVVEPVDEPSAITTLTPPPGIDVADTRGRLLREHGILTTAAGPERAPREMTGPVLRISPHVDATEADLRTLAAALPR